jgi:hypothetical protein
LYLIEHQDAVADVLFLGSNAMDRD